MSKNSESTIKEAQGVFVFHPVLPDSDPSRVADRLEEAVNLTQAISLDVLEARSVPLREVRPGTLFGKGFLEVVKLQVSNHKNPLVFIDSALSPVQQRNLERLWKVKVLDRTGLILEIFGKRARTAEGRLQVELASLQYQKSRLVRTWTHLERQRGGLGFIGGPGESQLEMDRRMIATRIQKIQKELEKVQKTRGLHRQARKRTAFATIALVGYTNAGKSTLFNALTQEKVMAEDMLFATLDPTMRQVILPSGRPIILSDTVGFISDLPTQLVAAFRSTLEEVLEADMILHVRDISHKETEHQKKDVLNVLETLGLSMDFEEARILEVLNKCDLLPHDHPLNQTNHHGHVTLSALTGQGIPELLARIDDALNRYNKVFEFHLPHEEGALLAWIYEHGDVLEKHVHEHHVSLTVSLRPEKISSFQRRFSKYL